MQTKALKPVRQRKTQASDGDQAADPYVSRATVKALRMLEFLRLQESATSLNVISQTIGLAKASTFRLLRTLELSGYLGVTAEGFYQFIPELGSGIPTQLPMRIARRAAPYVRDLSRDLRETVSLAVLFENRSEVVTVAESSELIRMSNVVGHILPPNASSLGKVVTAFQSPARRERLLRSFGVYRFTENTITDPASLEKEFEEVRTRGFARDQEETVYGGNCFGVPIFSPSGGVVGAVSMSLPKMRFGGQEHENAIVSALTSVAKNTSEGLL